MKPSRFIQYGINSLVYSNIFVSLCTAAYTAKTSCLLVGTNGSWHVNGIVFCATLLIYCFHRINKRKFLTPDEYREERNNWMSSHKNIYYILISLSLIILAVQVFYMPLKTWLVFIPVAMLGFGYTFPIIPTNKGWKRLRDIYWLKTFWIAFAFSSLTTFLPVMYLTPDLSLVSPGVLFIFSRSLLFIFAICIPFDIRDMGFDKHKGVSTLPVWLGVKVSIYVSIVLLLIFIVLDIVNFFLFHLNRNLAAALLLSAIVTITVLPFSKTKRHPLLFPLLFDGALLVQWIFVFAFMSL